jgi:hypothetical protein
MITVTSSQKAEGGLAAQEAVEKGATAKNTCFQAPEIL